MTYRPPLVLRVRNKRLGGPLAIADAPWGSLKGSEHLIVFVHGYNVGQNSAEDVWQRTHKILRERPYAVSATSLLPLLLFYWPGDLRWELLSKLNYFRKVQVAVNAGRLLADALSPIGTPDKPINVDFVGHSLGCRVVLSAAAALKATESVKIRHIVLMAAAVPEGLCEDGAPYGSDFVASQTATVIYSSSDGVLRKAFPLGQWAARHLINVPDTDPGINRNAVGYQGGPATRWSGEKASCGLDHGDYWQDSPNVGKLVPLFSEPKERQVKAQAKTTVRRTKSRTTRARRQPSGRRTR